LVRSIRICTLAFVFSLAALAPGVGLQGPAPAQAAAFDNQDHLYTLDGYGGVHAAGASPAPAARSGS